MFHRAIHFRSTHSVNAFCPVQEFFHRFRVSDIAPLPPGGLVYLNHFETLNAAVRKLAALHVLSAPVLDSNNMCIGILDASDIVSYVFRMVPSDRPKFQTQLDRLMIRNHLDSAHVHDALADSGHRKFKHALETDQGDQAIKDMGNGVHRVVVCNPLREITRMLTQSDVIRFTHKHMDEPILQKTLDTCLLDNDEIHHPKHRLTTVSSHATVYECLKRMRTENITALPIVSDQDGALVGNFSASDLRGVFEEKFPAFDQTALHFLMMHSASSTWPVSVKRNATVREIVTSFVRHRVHHVFVTDERIRPIGVITMTDVCNFFNSHQEKRAEHDVHMIGSRDTSRVEPNLTKPKDHGIPDNKPLQPTPPML
jgi:CBS domain-containing protein